MLFKALKTGFVENKGQSGPLSVVNKTQCKCQLKVKFLVVVSYNLISSICPLSVQTLSQQSSLLFLFFFFVVGPDGPLKEKKEEVPPARRLAPF